MRSQILRALQSQNPFPASSALLAALLFTLGSTAYAQRGVQSPYMDRPAFEGTLPARGIDPDSLLRDGAAGTTVANWQGSFVASGIAYTYHMLGTDPSSGSATTRINAILIPVKLTFSDGTVLDPSAHVFGETKSSVELVEASPVFQLVAFAPGGTNVGKTQYIDAFQRANFWNLVNGTAPQYHVLFTLRIEAPQALRVPSFFGSTQFGPGNRVGYVSRHWLDNQLAVLMFKLKIKPNTIPLFLVYDTFTTVVTNAATSYYRGYHSAFGAPAQVYSEFGFYDQSLYPTNGDITTASHEMAELTDDPFLTNNVPGWFNPETGSCGFDLEVGDPLIGVGLDPITLGGFTYHLQDLTFLPWFSQQSPSTSVNGWYTFGNTFSSASTTCVPAARRAQ